MVGKTIVALAALASGVAAQTTVPITVISDNSFNGYRLSGSHVGAAQNFIQAYESAGDPSFFINTTASQLQTTAIASGYALPCYVVNTPSSFAATAGPLECGATIQEGTDYSTVSTDTTSVVFTGISSWWVCTVNSYTYGNKTNTVVGSWGTDTPSGTGISGCVAITSLRLSGGSSSSNSTTTAPPSASSTIPSYTNGTIVTITTHACAQCTELITTTSVCYSACQTGTSGGDSSGGSSGSDSGSGSSGSGSDSGSETVVDGATATPSGPAATSSVTTYEGGADFIGVKSSGFALSAAFAMLAIFF